MLYNIRFYLQSENTCPKFAFVKLLHKLCNMTTPEKYVKDCIMLSAQGSTEADITGHIQLLNLTVLDFHKMKEILRRKEIRNVHENKVLFILNNNIC